MNTINYKSFIMMATTGFVLLNTSTCNSVKAFSKNNESNIIVTNNDVKSENAIEVENSDILEKEKDEIMIDYFEKLEKKLKKYINQQNFDKVKVKTIELAVTGIDFIFYGKEINGVTFEELSDTTKEAIISIVLGIDEKVEDKVPNYKDNIKDKFDQTYTYVTDKLKKGIDYVDEELENKYGDKYKEVKKKTSKAKIDVKETLIDTYDSLKDIGGKELTKIKNGMKIKLIK